MKYILIAILGLSPQLSFGQNNIFKWGEGLTYYTGEFDTTAFTKNEIEIIYNYLHTTNSEMLTVGNIWKIEQMNTASTIPIDNYYQKTLNVLQAMRIPKGQFWDSLLNHRKRELYEVCEDNRLFILALKNPAILYDHYHEECASEIIALNSDRNDLLQAWFELKESQKLKNCCPENLEKKYQTELNSPDRLKFARLELMIYGWGNCMNQFVYHYNDPRIEEEFQKLFIRVERKDYED